MAALGTMWQKLGDLPVPEPSLAMRARFEQTLDGLMAGQFSSRGEIPRRTTPPPSVLWPVHTNDRS